MSKAMLRWRTALLVLSAGTLLAFGVSGACLQTMLQRVLVGVIFD